MGIRLIEKILEKRRLKAACPHVIIYLYSLSTASPLSKDIIRMAGRSKLALQDLSNIFSKIYILVERWNYTLHKAAKYVSSQIAEKKLREFLARLSDSLNVNVNLSEFMKVEYEKMMAEKSAEFDRALERVKKFIEAYSALMTSSTFLSVSMILLAMIYGVEISRIITLTAICIVCSLAAMVLLTLKTMSPDPVIHDDPRKPERLLVLERANLPLMIAAMASSTLLMISLSPSESSIDPISTSMLMAGAPLFIIGWMGRRWVRSAEKMDEHYAPFIKSLGDALEVSGSLESACKLIAVNDYGPINKLLRRLMKRLKLGFDQGKVLEMLGVESLSNLALSMSRIEADSLRYGSRQSITSKTIHDYVLSHLVNRKKRRQVAGTLRGLAIPLQATFSAIAALISVLTRILSSFANLIRAWFPVIAPIPAPQVSAFFSTIAMAMALASSFMIYLIEGDSRFTLTYSLGTLLTIAGAIYLLSLTASKAILEMASGFIGELESILEEI